MPKFEMPSRILTDTATSITSAPMYVNPLMSVYGLNTALSASNHVGIWPAGALANIRPVFDVQNGTTVRAQTSLRIMTGPVPESADDVAKNITTYINNTLVAYIHVSGISTPFVSSVPTGTAPYTVPWLTVNTSYTAASASGKATWFCLVTQPATNVVTAGAAAYHAIIGTIGKNGSGSDVEIANDDVVAGKLYRLTGLKLSLPTSFEYE